MRKSSQKCSVNSFHRGIYLNNALDILTQISIINQIKGGIK